MPIDVRVAIVLFVMLVWIWGCFSAETWLEKYIKDHNRRMTIAPGLSLIWWLVWPLMKFCEHAYVRPAKELFAELDKIPKENL